MEDLKRTLRSAMGLPEPERAWGFAVNAADEGPMAAQDDSPGLRIDDLDAMIARHRQEGYRKGFREGERQIVEHLEKVHQLARNEQVAGALGMLSEVVLNDVGLTAQRALAKRGSTRAAIAEAVEVRCGELAESLRALAGEVRAGKLNR